MPPTPSILRAAMRAVPCLAVALCAASPARSEDWPQWGGPRRDNVSAERGLLRTWPEGGPKRAWTADGLGIGVSSPSVSRGVIYVSGVIDKTGCVTALSLTGARVWQKPYGAEFTADGRGSRTTPTVSGGRIYLMSGLGRLVCMDARTGSVLWSVDTARTLGAQQIDWGITESVLVDGDLVICTPGGTGGSVAAYNRITGTLVWATRGLTEKSAYCSPAVITRGKTRLIVTRLATHIVGLDARTGEVLWSRPDTSKNSVHGVSPIYRDGLLFYTNWDETQGTALHLSEDGRTVDDAWKAPELANGYSGTILVDGRLYGSEDVRNRWFCADMTTGKSVATAPGHGSLVCADGMLYTVADNGTVNLMTTQPKPFEVAGAFRLKPLREAIFAHPIISGGRLYIRNAETLTAYAVR